MKKYILFAFDTYYPRGGMDDLYDDYDTLEEAKTAAWAADEDNFQIVDRDTWEVEEQG